MASVGSAAVAAAERFARLVDGVDHGAGDRAVKGSPSWTVREVVAHVSTAAPGYLAGIEGRQPFAQDADDLTELNASNLRELDRRPLAELAASIVSDVRALDRQITGLPDAPIEFHFGSVTTPTALAGVLLGELLVHGRDLAVTLGRPWPIGPAEVHAVFKGFEPLLPALVDPGAARRHTATYEIRLPGAGSHWWSFERQQFTCHTERPHRVDCHITGDPATLLLVMYRRLAPSKAVVTGRTIAWGRRPWLALNLPRRFHVV